MRNLYITIFLLFFKIVQNVYVSWIFLGGLSLSHNKTIGVVGGEKKFVTNLSHLTPKTGNYQQSLPVHKSLIINCYLLQVIAHT